MYLVSVICKTYELSEKFNKTSYNDVKEIIRRLLRKPRYSGLCEEAELVIIDMALEDRKGILDYVERLTFNKYESMNTKNIVTIVLCTLEKDDEYLSNMILCKLLEILECKKLTEELKTFSITKQVLEKLEEVEYE